MGYFQDRIKNVDRVLFAKFVQRRDAEFQIIYDSPSLSRPTFWVDEFVLLSDDGKRLEEAPLRVVTARYVGSGVAPKPNETYLLLVTKPLRGETRMLVEHFPVGTLRIETPATAEEVAGLACTSVNVFYEPEIAKGERTSLERSSSHWLPLWVTKQIDTRLTQFSNGFRS